MDPDRECHLQDPTWDFQMEDPNSVWRTPSGSPYRRIPISICDRRANRGFPPKDRLACRQPRLERTEGSSSAMLAGSQAAFLCRDVLRPGPAFIDPSHEGRPPPSLAPHGPLFLRVYMLCCSMLILFSSLVSVVVLVHVRIVVFRKPIACSNSPLAVSLPFSCPRMPCWWVSCIFSLRLACG